MYLTEVVFFTTQNDFTAGFSSVHEVDDFHIVFTAKASGQIPDRSCRIILCLAIDKGESSCPAKRVNRPGKDGFRLPPPVVAKKHYMAGQIVHTQPQLPTYIPDALITNIKYAAGR